MAASDRYDPSDSEPRWLKAWLDSGALDPDPSGPGDAYAIAIPPPNVTGALHMGHALNNTIQDVLIRSRRMAGDQVKWICGTDHAGIATQAIVEKDLAQKEGRSRHDLGREAFLERVWEWREEYGGTIIGQLQRLGATLDYGNERFTMDEGYANAVLRVFVDMYEKGYVYRDNYMVNWDTGLGSAISDLEVEDREVLDTLVEIAYPLSSGEGELVVATVRPETMLGDTAVAVNPDDERYGHLIGQTCVLPLVGRELPIIGDDYVDPEFGTGALKVTPAHDPNDFEMGKRHGLEAISVIGEDGAMTDAVPERYRGLPAAECQARVTEELRAAGVLRGEEPYTHTVPFSHRSGARVEPLISLQWFADMTQLAQPAIAAVEDGRVRFTPERWGDVYLAWMREIRPWCLSRQLWWGHQLPVWYRGDEIYVGVDGPEGDGWVRDEDVLDTWFSSGLWPFATLGWPEATPELERFYPNQVLSTARDIIFLWVARMVMMGLEYLGEVPFSEVYIHSVIQAPDGRRMSKSLGTGIDPVEVIDEHGADALRFGLLMMSSAQDVRFNHERVAQGRQLVTKLWNASRLVVERGGTPGPCPTPQKLADRWMASRLTAAIEESESLVREFDFSRQADLLYHLIFDEFADWYLELLKAGEATPQVAGPLLEQLLALAHPQLPFVTEECWHMLSGSDELMLTHASASPPASRDAEAEATIEGFQELVTSLRSYKSEHGLARRDRIEVRLEAGEGVWSPPDGLAGLVNAEMAEVGEGAHVVPASFGSILVLPPEIDMQAERARLDAAITAAEKELARAEKQLGNEQFVSRAPAELVEAERDKAARYTSELKTLRAQLAAAGGK
ncbi:MAG: valine--tRNA ligase [Thermoleophilia bacterium]|nr:valine--tRNA ligase [Thermoleophilia bacterium]